MKDILSIYEKKCNIWARFWNLLFSDQKSLPSAYKLKAISGIMGFCYLYFFLSQISSAFCVQLFAQWDKKSAIAASKYSRLSGNPEELLQNDTMGNLGTEHTSASIDQGQRLSEMKRGCSAVISVSAFDIFQPQSQRCWLWWISGDFEVGLTLGIFVWYLVYTLVQGRWSMDTWLMISLNCVNN